ncbi:TRAP-type C4-dicarboxylate transport system substrate-binding protein [Georgenia soli]|uniref:TRAP-type C4-dicarboxylate transport system substrate-binding protein n=1 Tax=Georgenia soli TaxID=638953 RepID=A0A2A9EMJ1_9MICO|nr:TRAP-type C4-dicarboxylate transport system substrate-binding protein [Georgenia soli]
MATMTEPAVPNAAVMNWFVDEVEARSDGRLTFDVTPPNSLCPANEIAVCTQDGRADVGVAIPDYTPQIFPTITVVSVPFVAADSQALVQSLYEINHEHEGAREVWAANDLKMIAHWSGGRLTLGSPEPIESIDDLQGLRWRMSGPYLQRAMEQVGGSNVALTAPETYEAVERGVVDAVGFALDGAVDYQLMELLPYWTDAGTGHYNTFGMWFNQDTYDGLPDDLRKIVDEVTAELNGGEAVRAFSEVAETQCEALMEHPNVETLDAWSDEAVQQWDDAVGDKLLERWITDAEANGLSDARGYLDAYMEKLETHGDQIPDPLDLCVERFSQ